ncbi:MAG TPA: hypothetical protein VNQ73_11400 [Ilumatobacter sp.]|nr:hypothetical protein [Ilumatobacter sp.]
MIRRTPRRLIGWLVWPPGRALAALLIWSHRQTLALWGRSLAAELRRHPRDPQRLMTLVRTLWKVSTDPRLRGVSGIRSLSVDTDLLGDTDPSIRATLVRATLLDVAGVVSVEVSDPAHSPVAEPELPGVAAPV